jgi:DNA-binding NarL/FixJ family response regulator
MEAVLSLTMITRQEPVVDGSCAHLQIALESEARLTLELMATGLASSEIGDRLGTSTEAVHGHLFDAMLQLGASSKLEAIIKAVRRGLISLP